MSSTVCESMDEAIGQLLQIAGNNRCVDCSEASPRWISLNFGVFVCLNCAGHHRSLGTHITSVKSIELDEFLPSYKRLLLLGGNQNFLEYLSSLANRELRPADSVAGSGGSVGAVGPISVKLPIAAPLDVSSAPSSNNTSIPSQTQALSRFFSKVRKYGIPEVLYYSEILRAKVEDVSPRAFDASYWNSLIKSPDSTISSKSVAAWVPDSANGNCMICGSSFTLLHRRHHCRRCGKLVCSDCAPGNNCRPIIEWGLRDPVRHCKECYKSPAIHWVDKV